MEIHFEWDPIKAASNLRMHGVSFGEAAEVFSDPLALTLSDVAHSETEERWITMGQAHGRRLVVVIHTWQENETLIPVRIISAREATTHEFRQYQG